MVAFSTEAITAVLLFELADSDVEKPKKGEWVKRRGDIVQESSGIQRYV